MPKADKSIRNSELAVKLPKLEHIGLTNSEVTILWWRSIISEQNNPQKPKNRIKNKIKLIV